MADEGSTKFICAYAAIWNAPITSDTDHISQVKSLSLDEVNQLKRDLAWMLTPTFLHLWDAFHAEPS